MYGWNMKLRNGFNLGSEVREKAMSLEAGK
jgi:hypothetical protein